jgi:hypothetical protein
MGFRDSVKKECHGARPVHLIITVIKWIGTSRLSIKKSLSRGEGWSLLCRPLNVNRGVVLPAHDDLL